MKIYTDELEGNRIVPTVLDVDNILFKDRDVCYKIVANAGEGIRILKQTSGGQSTIKIIPVVSNIIIIE